VVSPLTSSGQDIRGSSSVGQSAALMMLGSVSTSACMAENGPGSVQQRATDRVASISCNTPRQTGVNSEYQRSRVKRAELDFSAYPQVTEHPSTGFPS
jgi:hypothetical protein